MDARRPSGLLGRRLPGRLVAGPRPEDALRVAAELVSWGRRVALEHAPAGDDDAADELAALAGRVERAGLAAACDLAVPVDRLGEKEARRVVAAAAGAGLSVTLEGAGAVVDRLAEELPGAGVVVAARELDAEARCRRHADGRVRLVAGRGTTADLAFVRCLNVLMAAAGTPGIAATDRRLVAITGERAAWNERTPDSWEHVMPLGVRTDEQQRLVAAGARVRVAVPSGPAAVAVVARRLVGRS